MVAVLEMKNNFRSIREINSRTLNIGVSQGSAEDKGRSSVGE